MAFLECNRWPPSRGALISGSTIQSLNCYAALRLLICLLYGHWPEETRVRWPWDTFCVEPQVDSMDQPIFVSDPVISSSKYPSIGFLSNKSLTLGIFFSTSVKVFYFPLFLGLTSSWIGCFLMIELTEVFFLLFLRVIWRVSSVSLDKISPCPDKPETLKLSLWMCIYESFSILVLLLE